MRDKRNARSLKFYLLLIPALVILATFLLIIIFFNFAGRNYIGKIAERQIEDEFEFFDQYYNGDSPEISYEKEESETVQNDFFMNVYTIILDENYEAVKSDLTNFYSAKELKRMEIVSSYFKVNGGNKGHIILNDGDESLYAIGRVYRGISQDGLSVIKAESGEEEKEYTVVVYTNISQLANFTGRLYLIFLVVMTLFGILLIASIFWINKKIDSSFSRIKAYVLSIGKREEVNKPKKQAFREFNDVVDTVEEMSGLIKAGEESTKQFFQNASHELRTPLMSIMGYAEGIALGVMKDYVKSARIIEKESAKMASLVDEILFLSRMDTGTVMAKNELLDLKELLFELAYMIDGSASKKNIRLEVDIRDEELAIFADEKSVERAIVNILSNAVKYACELISLRVVKEKGFINISVTDDGEGIAPKDLPHIFERFYKGEKGNFGIGLSITDTVVKSYGGRVSVTSEPGHTEFVISLPEWDGRR